MTITTPTTAGVYFIEGAGRIKIGVSEYPEGRLRKLQSMSPVRLTLLAVIPGAGRDDELHYHRILAAHRLHGEWFATSPLLLAFIDHWRGVWHRSLAHAELPGDAGR